MLISGRLSQSKQRILGPLLLSLIFGSSLDCAKALNLSGLQKPASVTVFFETDRQLNADGIHFGDQQTQPLDYTVIGSIDATPGMLRQLFIGGYKSNNPIHKFASFEELATTARSQNQSDKIIVFIHGCCTNFPLAAAQAASLSEHTGATVLMYDWGSPLISYGGSLLTYPRSQERFNDFMLNVAHAFPEKKLSVVGFSMGNQLLDNFLLQYRPAEVGHEFDQLVFSSADTDAVAFRSHLARITPHAKHTFVYLSSNDTPLFISNALRTVASPKEHGNRLGDARSKLGTDGTVTVVDVSPLKMNHSIPYTVISEFLASDGETPVSTVHEYRTLSNGLVEVSDKHKTAE